MNPETPNQNGPATPDSAAPQAGGATPPPSPVQTPGLGVTPPPADAGVPSAKGQNMAQPAMPSASPAAGSMKSKMPFLIGVGLVVIVLIAAIVFLAF